MEKFMKNKTPLVTISLLVSNRIDTIRKCLESLRPLLTQVPSELIVVDTVGEENSDGSLMVAKEYADRIVHFDWCNDFSAARNAGLSLARGEWFVYMDDDEWFEDISPMIRFFTSGDYKNYDRAWYTTRDYQDKAGLSYQDNYADRMCRIVPGLAFQNRVHEYLSPVLPRVARISCHTNHYGYAYANDEERKQHLLRNISLLEVECEEHPQDARLAGQLVCEYLASEEYDKAEGVCARTLKLCEDEFDDVMVQFLALAECRIAIVQEKWEEAEKKVDALQQRKDILAVPGTELWINTAKIKEKVGKFFEVLDAVERFFACKEAIRMIGPDAELQAVFDLRRFLTEEQERTALAYGLRAIIETKLYDKAKDYLEKINWQDTECKPFEHMLLLTELYGKSGRKELFFPYAEQIAKNPQMQKQFQVALEELRRNYPQRMLTAEERELIQVFSEALVTAKHLPAQSDVLFDLLAGMQEVVQELQQRVNRLPKLEECYRLLFACSQAEKKEALAACLQEVEAILLEWC